VKEAQLAVVEVEAVAIEPPNITTKSCFGEDLPAGEFAAVAHRSGFLSDQQ